MPSRIEDQPVIKRLVGMSLVAAAFVLCTILEIQAADHDCPPECERIPLLPKPGIPPWINLPHNPDADGRYQVTWGAASGTVQRYEFDEYSHYKKIHGPQNLYGAVGQRRRWVSVPGPCL